MVKRVAARAPSRFKSGSKEFTTTAVAAAAARQWNQRRSSEQSQQHHWRQFQRKRSKDLVGMARARGGGDNRSNDRSCKLRALGVAAHHERCVERAPTATMPDAATRSPPTTAGSLRDLLGPSQSRSRGQLSLSQGRRLSRDHRCSPSHSRGRSESHSRGRSLSRSRVVARAAAAAVARAGAEAAASTVAGDEA